MKKVFTKKLLVSCFVSVLAGTTFAQNAGSLADCDAAPTTGTSVQTVPSNTNQAAWTILFNYDLFAKTGFNGNAGVCYLNSQIWVTRWATDSILILDPLSGTVLSRFTVPGVTGIRSLTTDGTFIYAGINTSSIKKIDAVAKTLVSSITAPIANVRSLSYDATANSGAGGFWVSTWATDITQIDMNGAILKSVPAASHGLLGMYGTATDNVSSGGPYLWVFDQNTSAEKSDIVQVDIAAQAPTAVIHDVMADVGTPQGDTSGLAGGLFFYQQVPNYLVLAGVLQGSPTNRLFAYQIGFTGIGENSNEANAIGIYPNPVKDLVNIQVNKQNNDEARLQIFDATGRMIFNKNTRALNNYINLSKYGSGLYFVKATYNGQSYTSKLVKQ